MAVLHDYNCMAHGVFESMTGNCPHGCGKSMVEITYIQPAGLTSFRTKNIDKTLGNLASDFKLTDMNNQNGTSAVVRPNSKAVAAQNQLMGKLGDTRNAWGQVPQGTSGINQALASSKAIPDNALQSIRPALQQPKPMVVGRHDGEIKA